MVISRFLGWQKEYIRKKKSLLKVLIWRLHGAKIKKGVVLYGDIYIDGSLRNLSIGDNTVINHNVYINCREKVKIGSRCNISSGVKIITTGLKGNNVHTSKPIEISDDVWIGSAAIILSGCYICNSSIIGAAGVVNKNINCSGVYVGVPVRKIK